MTDSYKEILINHGDKIEIDSEIDLYAYMGSSYTRDIEGIATGTYEDTPDVPYKLKDAKIYKGLWRMNLDNVNPEILTDKGRECKKIGGELVYTFELEPTLAFAEDDGEVSNFYTMATDQEYHDYIRCDLICTVEDTIKEHLELD